MLEYCCFGVSDVAFLFKPPTSHLDVVTSDCHLFFIKILVEPVVISAMGFVWRFVWGLCILRANSIPILDQVRCAHAFAEP